jgi:hypothetical protein
MGRAYPRQVAGLLLATFLLVTAGCDGGTQPGAAGATTSATAGSPGATSGVGGAPTTPAAPGGNPANGSPRCTVDHLKISETSAGGAAGHWGTILLFRNSGSSGCHLQGYPGVAGLDANGKQATQARRTAGGYIGGSPAGEPQRIELAAGATASALVEGSNVPEGNATDCPTYQGLLVTPPDETHSVHLSGGGRGCSGLEIHPVVAGPDPTKE